MKENNLGITKIPIKNKVFANCIASNEFGWEHVSVHIVDKKIKRIPTWDEMCYVKSLFWEEEDWVIQYHPAKSEYVNNDEFVLHLWRPLTSDLPIPPSWMVGIKDLTFK